MAVDGLYEGGVAVVSGGGPKLSRSMPFETKRQVRRKGEETKACVVKTRLCHGCKYNVMNWETMRFSTAADIRRAYRLRAFRLSSCFALP